jgi:hypothetical protein
MRREGGKNDEALLRRARREDIAILHPAVGGPAAGRVRALRRLLKTLVADVYVLDRTGRIDGVISLNYRRSFAAGGLVATIDVLLAFREGASEKQADIALLLDHGLLRANKRGCVAIEGCGMDTGLTEALRSQGFGTGPALLHRSLRAKEIEG